MDRQRIDKWLWHARVVRTRNSAAGLAGSGHVRVNGRRIALASQVVRPGDVITVGLDRSVRVLKVLAFAERRGSADLARGLYEEIRPPRPPDRSPPPPEPGTRDRGTGRPTKRDRREIDRFTRDD